MATRRRWTCRCTLGRPSGTASKGSTSSAPDSGDAFSALIEPYRRQLQVHCYRMVGSFDDAEDLVQETMLRAWRSRATFEGRSLLRTWLYRIATNACLNALERSPRRVTPKDVVAPVTVETDTAQARATPPWRPELPWLQPYPDELLAPQEDEPEAGVVSRETIELTFLAAIQHLPPRQRAVLLLSDALGWSAKEVAEILELSVAAVNSALQRARTTMRAELPAQGNAPRSEDEQAVLRTFMDAWERADAALLTGLLRDDARWAMPPAALWFDGREAIGKMFELFPIDWQGREFRMVATAANRQPAAAVYMRAAGEAVFRLVSVHVLRVEDGKIAEVTAFAPSLCRSFGLADEFSADPGLSGHEGHDHR